MDFDAFLNKTRIAFLDKTDVNTDVALFVSGMPIFQPTRIRRTTVSNIWCCLWNPVPSRPFKAVPFFFQLSCTVRFTRVVNGAVGVINDCVVAAFKWLCGCKSRNNE